MATEMPLEIGAFEFHGVDISRVVNKQIQTTCPFCKHDDTKTGDGHFFISIDTKTKKNPGQFQCKSCGVEGNRYTFLHLLYKECLDDTTPKDYKAVAKVRNWKDVNTFADSALAYCRERDRWLYPVYNDKGSLVDLLSWSGKKGDKWFHTKGCLGHFIGMENLLDDGPIFICEGLWDFLSLQHFFPEIDERKRYTILGCPSCNSWPIGDVKKHFTNRDIIFLYDSGLDKGKHDGLDGQERSAIKCMKEHRARSAQILEWPESYPKNYDISDLMRDKGEEPAWKLILGYLKAYTTKALAKEKVGDYKTFADVVKAFRESGVKINRDFSDAMLVTLAGIISVRFGGRPLWLFLIGPPGQGKSLILEATRDVDDCEYVADLSRQALVSGYTKKEDEDPSLLARIGGRVLIIKDYSALLNKGQQQLDETISVLRECYDGRFVRPFGNIVRIYPDPSTGLDYWFFGLVAGATREIHRAVKASMGDQQRLLKIDLGACKGSTMEVTLQAITNKQEPWREIQRAKKRQDAVTSFLTHTVINPEKPPHVTKAMVDRIAYLSHASAICRAYIPRERGTEDLYYEASIEGTGRLAEQLTLLAQCLAALMQDLTADKRESEILRLLAKVALHTSHGWREKVYGALARSKKSMTPIEVARAATVSPTTTAKMLKDLQALHIATRVVGGQQSSGGKKADLWLLTREGREVADKSKMFL